MLVGEDLREGVRIFARAGEIRRLECWPGHSDGHLADSFTVAHKPGECQSHSRRVVWPVNVRGAGRSVFEHAVNYRCAVIYGYPRIVSDPGEVNAGLR